LKGRRFCNATDIIKNATEDLQRLSQNGSQECFQHFCSCWQKFIVAPWAYFKGNLAYIIVCFVFLRNKVIPGIFWRYYLYNFLLSIKHPPSVLICLCIVRFLQEISNILQPISVISMNYIFSEILITLPLRWTWMLEIKLLRYVITCHNTE